MTSGITEAEWDKLLEGSFDTYSLLHAVDTVDELRGDLNDGDHGAPPELRTNLLKLHQLAAAVFNQGSRSQVRDLFELATDLDDQVSGMMDNLEKLQETLSKLVELYPESLYD
jgi:hypothetical protein